MKRHILIPIILCLFACSYLAWVRHSRQESIDGELAGAAIGNDVAGMKIALEHGANIEATHIGSGGRTPLMMAALFGNLDAIEFLIRNKADVNHREMGGKTALFYTRSQYPDCTIALLKAGANPNIKDEYGEIALDVTDPKIQKLLKDAGAKDIKSTGLVVPAPKSP